jgi:hypothetical protein
MILDFSDIAEAYERTWKCLGCGREVFENAERQAEDEQLLERIRNAAH